MSAAQGAFEQGDRDLKIGKLNLVDLPPLPAASSANSATPAPAPAPAPVPTPTSPSPAVVVASIAPPTPPAPTPAPAPAPTSALPPKEQSESSERDANSESESKSYSGPPPAALRTCLMDLTEPIAKRTHAAFYLRTLGTNEAVLIVLEALQQREDSALMRHELAYILGQIGNTTACPNLAKILEDEADDVLVRHECAEALGAIGHSSSSAVLSKYTTHAERDISETCQIALELIAYRNSPQYLIDKQKLQQGGGGKFLSVDPAPPYSEQKPIATLLADLQNPSQSLFLRYRAMFTLRDMNTDESALALCQGLKDPSALFRHEIAYVLGQMQRPVTVDALTEVVTNTAEHRMVRHEAAEALGSIGGDDVEMVLGDLLDDPELVVSESCEVALDTLDYWEEFKQASA